MKQLELPFYFYQVCAHSPDTKDKELLCLVGSVTDGAEYVFSELAARGELYEMLADDDAYLGLDDIYDSIEAGDVVGGYSVSRAL